MTRSCGEINNLHTNDTFVERQVAVRQLLCAREGSQGWGAVRHAAANDPEQRCQEIKHELARHTLGKPLTHQAGTV